MSARWWQRHVLLGMKRRTAMVSTMRKRFWWKTISSNFSRLGIWNSLLNIRMTEIVIFCVAQTLTTHRIWLHSQPPHYGTNSGLWTMSRTDVSQLEPSVEEPVCDPETPLFSWPSLLETLGWGHSIPRSKSPGLLNHPKGHRCLKSCLSYRGHNS